MNKPDSAENTTATSYRAISPGGKKIVLILMFVGIAAMFVWSFVYRAANPSTTARVERAPNPQASNSMDSMMGGAAMKTIMDAMARLKASPDDVGALRQAAEAFAAVEMWERAGQLADKGLAKAPDDPALLNIHGVVLFKTDHGSEAAKAFERVLELTPGDPLVQFNLGVVYKEALKDEAKAKSYFEAVLNNPKTDPETKEQVRQELNPPINAFPDEGQPGKTGQPN